MIGQTVAHYRVLDKLGGGGMGEVYLAEDTRLHRRVAIKVLPPLVASDAEHLERFAREAKALAGLNHPNIVTVYSVEEAGDQRLLVMELIEGRTLSALIPEGGLTEERFFELAIPLADALSAAHARGVTHRDLKPSNVMVTEDGRVKVVDFGLAKLRQEAEARERTVVLEEELTEEGRILGTYPYMSPEQIKGKPVDHRSDIFSLGVVLYEMATGERPFSGETSADLISSILRDTPPPAHELNRKLPRHLDRILAHCLEKDPESRFQTAKDLRNELRSLLQEVASERLLRSTSIARRLVSTGETGKRLRGRLAAGILVTVLAVVGGLLLWSARENRPTPTEAGLGVAPSGETVKAKEHRPSVAVLFFQNLTGSPELEWLRTGLTEMLVTDLSQAPGLRVISTDRLYQVLRDMKRLDDPVLSADLVRDVAEKTDASTVLLGSFAQVGETFQVNVTVKDAVTGEILDAQRIQGTGESSVFTIVDQLSNRVLGLFEGSGQLASAMKHEEDRNIESVTTSSVAAYRLYAEGMRLYYEFKIDEAITLFRRATELDPEFAMAHARLARIYETLGREKDLEGAIGEAMAHVERLTPRERSIVEATFYGRQRATYGRAVEVLEETLELYPDHNSAGYQLGLLYLYLELHDQAISRFEDLISRGYDHEAVYNGLATAYEAEGRVAESERLLRRWNSSTWASRLVVAWHATIWGEASEASQALHQAEALRPESPFVEFFCWRAASLNADWDRARACTRKLMAEEQEYWRWRGLTGLALLDLYGGRPVEGLQHLDEASETYSEKEALLGTGWNMAAETLLMLGQPSAALEEASRAQQIAENDWPAWEGLFWAAIAQQRLGKPAEADRLAAELEPLGDLLPGQVEERLYHRLLGVLAWERGDGAAAVRELELAESMLPPRGLAWHRHRLPDHVPLWYELATVYRKLGNADEAELRYRRITESGVEHLYHPIQYVRSHYYLAKLLEGQGDATGARAAYRKFLDFWDNGEIDRDLVADARVRLKALGS